MTDVQIGPRQTVDRACHPTLGEGVAVYDNGPAFFRADSGEVAPMRRIGMGGCGVGGSYLNATDTAGTMIRLDTTKREHGPQHERVTGRTHGTGWLVSGGQKHPDASLGWAMYHRFEPDRGEPFEFWAQAMWVGLPKHGTRLTRKLSKKDQGQLDVEIKDCPWMTIQDVDGECFVYRRGEEPLAQAMAAVAAG